jgi:cation diffusion facilitator CzcD-associated flavoprotein CzcO
MRVLREERQETLYTPLESTKGTMMSSSTIGKQAIVIGAGMSGLAAAGALADYFEEVLILEHDGLPIRPVPRKGTPQSRHLHVLLPGGHAALSDLFPNFAQDLITAGAVPIGVNRDFRMEEADRPTPATRSRLVFL